jgi:hypothetical protein
MKKDMAKMTKQSRASTLLKVKQDLEVLYAVQEEVLATNGNIFRDTIEERLIVEIYFPIPNRRSQCIVESEMFVLQT